MLLPGGATETGMIPEVFRQSKSVDFTFPHYNLIYREEECEMLPFCQDQKSL
jgi:aryl-alcohol dehydrogenase-like predicted oxidoreductase